MPAPALTCTADLISRAAEFGYSTTCDFVLDVCADKGEVVNFFNIYYCGFQQNLPVFAPLGILFLLLSFYLLSSTAEDFLEPVLSKISDNLKFSESLAGVTLVALANGAPDVFAAFAAANSSEFGIVFTVGSLFGAGCFVCSVVFAVCILYAKQGSIQVESSALIRDAAFYFIGGAWILYHGIMGTIGIVAAIGLFVNYGIFIGVVVIQEIRIKRAERIRELEEEEEQARRPSHQVFSFLAYSKENESGRVDMKSLLKNDHVQDGPTDPEEKKAAMEQREKALKRGQIEEAKRNFKLKRAATHSTIIKVQWTYYKMRHKVYNELVEIQENTFIGKILSVIKSPFNLMREVTIPVSTQERWNKNLAIIQPALTSVFCAWQFGILDDIYASPAKLALFCSGVGLFSLYICKSTIPSTAPQGFLAAILLVTSFVTCIVWINLVANIFVDFVKLLAVFTGLPSTYLGLTVLAWGNSMNDLFVDSALAKKGLGQVAISGVFAGQFFNLSIGFGISLLRQAFNNKDAGGTGEIAFNFFESDPTNGNIVSLILIACLLFNLFSTLVYGCLARFNLKKPYGVYLVLCYLGCFIAATLLCVFFRGE